MNAVDAETLALKALAYLAHSPDDLERFVALSGVTLTDLKDRAEDPENLAAVLDFILATDELVTGFCETVEIDPRDLHAARRALPGA